MTELGIVDIREIIRAIKSFYNYDFGNYALTSFKQRLERLIIRNNLTNADSLIKKLRDEPDFFDIFLHEISVPSTEMFRDPSLWRWLREELLPSSVEKSIGKFKIWLPNCVSGSELFSLMILLSEMKLIDKASIIASSLSNKSIEIIKEGQYDLKKIEVSTENYIRANGSANFTDYYRLDRYYAFRDISLISNVEFNKLNINFDNAPTNVKLILFRNSLIYYNPTLQDRILSVLNDSLSASGNLITGIKERISGVSSSKDFEIINEAESVYKKRIIG
jgi:chemotaxis protein methyltransferase CheR